MSDLWITYRDAVFPIGPGESTIGRSSECQVMIADPSVSRRHATIRVAEQTVLIDQGSRFGTVVNGVRLNPSRPVAPGDSILLGRVVIQLCQSLGDVEPWKGPRLLYREDEPELTTNTDVSSVKHIRMMILRALERRRPLEQAWLIRKAIDRAVTDWRASAPKDPTSAERLLAAADLVASWYEDGSLDAWRAELGHLLAADPT